MNITMDKEQYKKEFGERLKKYRESKNITQDELARSVGYNSRSSINKIELGINLLEQTKIPIVAKKLGISVNELMGWESKEEEPIHEENHFEPVTEIEQQLLELFRMLPAENQQIVLVQVEALAIAQKSKKKLP